jgi:hypothetical protein
MQWRSELSHSAETAVGLISGILVGIVRIFPCARTELSLSSIGGKAEKRDNLDR